MREFHKFSPNFWTSPSVRALPDDGKYLLVYFITNPHQNACGCFTLPDGYAITDLRWEIGRYQMTRAEIASASLIAVDENTNEILVTKWFRHNPAMNPSHRKSIVAGIERIASERLRAMAWQGLTDAESDARAKQEAKAIQAASASPLLRTPLLTRVR